MVRINGPDFDALRSEADAILEIVKGIDGVSEPRVSLVSNTPQIDVEVDLEAARRHGLKPGDVRRASAVLVAGEEVGDVFQNGRAYDVQVWSTPETRNSLTSIVELPLDTPSGEMIRLGDVADVRISPSPNTIKRENLTRYIDVEANVSGKDLGSVTRDVERAIKEYNFPLEYRAEVLGEFKERQSAQRRMAFLGIIAALGTFLLLQASFRSWRLATMAFFTLPIALMGGVLAALAGGGVLSLGSLVGFFTVFGIAARNGILMINHFQHLEKHEGGDVWSRAGAARGQGTTGADPDDGVDNGPGARASRCEREHRWPGDRVSARDRDPRRSWHVDPAEPVRRPGALSEIRKEQRRAAAGAEYRVIDV